ncbi:hypothetical protein [Lutibacter sp. B1]|uniref:hypothetical protein n=1 Tax=Lutibacter sp. B1 TaxID=2725996 RepID=UPI001457747F|nr:hypothetical protein [Lutibacter sp. B1]NLP59196.1 hypothetical protein [Lutibacter sp. B1]
MTRYNFTLRFDDDNHSLTAENGISIGTLSELLTSLSKAVSLQRDDKLVLSEIRGNCYALNLTTNSEVVQESLIVVHRKISTNDYTGLNSNQRSYAQKIKTILGDNLTLQAYNDTQSFKVEFQKIELPKLPDYYNQISTINGVITSIGGRSLKGKSTIHVAGFNFDIEISFSQEKKLAKYFKEKELIFFINKKISMDDDEIKSAELESFEVPNDNNFIDTATEIRKKFGDEIIEKYKDKYFKG